MDHTILDNAQAARINLSGASLSLAQARNVDFTSAIMDKMHSLKTDFTGSKFNDADLRNAEITKAILKGINCEKAKINEATKLAAKTMDDAKGIDGILDVYDNHNQKIGKYVLRKIAFLPV